MGLLVGSWVGGLEFKKGSGFQVWASGLKVSVSDSVDP